MSLKRNKQHFFLLLFSSCLLECGRRSRGWNNHHRGNLGNQTMNWGAIRENKPGLLALLYVLALHHAIPTFFFFFFFLCMCLSRVIGFAGGSSGKEPVCQCRRHKRLQFSPWVQKIPWRRAWQPTHYSCLKNPMDRGAWQAIVHRVANESDKTEAA